MPDPLLYREEAYQIIGACFAVYREKGHGFAEAVYQDSLEIELEHSAVPYEAQRNFQITHRGQPLRHSFTPNLVCFGKILVELKAVRTLADEHRAQVLNYLKVAKLQLALLVNFGAYPQLQWERLVLTHP
ncbi:GxxExxY protein [Opitutus sp. ER46]|uniref:GxxExxY protein n=1 Tax=Opitutus sp. ER46 TaxID=2161864 RepID=UPI000D3115F5|nr:GxxExxY protein [Opitutus sp. ER46]PTX97722.1 GxxExxY protein [Opitutus sp. ER46]